MSHMIKTVFFALILVGCSMPPINLFKGSSTLSLLSLPSTDNGYANLKTRVITTQKEYKAFLSAIDTQRYWEHKVAFGMKIAKAHIDFRKENLLIYRHKSSGSKAVSVKTASTKENNVTVEIIESSETLLSRAAQAFFYKVSKKTSKVCFRSKQRVVTVKNTKSSATVPKECIAWFDGCNHCIRSTTGRALCTKRYCKKKGSFPLRKMAIGCSIGINLL